MRALAAKNLLVACRTPWLPRRLGWAAVWLLTAALFGCGGGNRLPVAPASGVVTLDGEPVAEGVVIFTPERGQAARAEIQPDGTFVLATYGVQDGAIVGKHRAAVIARRGGSIEEQEPEEPVLWIVPQRYAAPATAGLEYEIKAGEKNVIQLPLTSR